MKMWMGIGPVKIRRVTDNRGTLEAKFKGYIRRDYTIKLDTVNDGAVSKTGRDISRIRGVWIEFDLALVDPPSTRGGTDGAGNEVLMQIFNDILMQSDEANQTVQLIPAESSQSNSFITCKIKSDITLDPLLDGVEAGQSVALRLRTASRLSVVPEIFSNGNSDLAFIGSRIQ